MKNTMYVLAIVLATVILVLPVFYVFGSLIYKYYYLKRPGFDFGDFLSILGAMGWANGGVFLLREIFFKGKKDKIGVEE